MRRTTLARSTRNTPWRSRAVRLALALTGTALMATIAAAEIGARPGLGGDAAFARTIRAQRVAQGLPANVEAPKVEAQPPVDPNSREGILAEVAKLEGQMTTAIAHVEQLKVVAYHEKNLIRMSFLTAKLSDMKQIMAIAAPAFAQIREPGQDVISMRAKLTLIRQGWERVKESASAADAAMNDDSADSLNQVGSANAEGSPSRADPTLPPESTPATDVFERPGDASPFK